jgi:hypothetical protein
MEFIEESFNHLQNHLLANGLKKKKKNFNLINSISKPSSASEDIDAFFLGTLINREKTPRDKIYLEDKQYKVVDNSFDLYFAISSNEFDTLAMIFRIFADFEVIDGGVKVTLLNSKKELDETPIFVKTFLKQDNNYNVVVVKLSKNVPSLLTPPTIKEVKKVEMITEKISTIKKDKQLETKKDETIVSYIEQTTSQDSKKTKIITEISQDYEKVVLKKKKDKK